MNTSITRTETATVHADLTTLDGKKGLHLIQLHVTASIGGCTVLDDNKQLLCLTQHLDTVLAHIQQSPLNLQPISTLFSDIDTLSYFATLDTSDSRVLCYGDCVSEMLTICDNVPKLDTYAGIKDLDPHKIHQGYEACAPTLTGEFIAPAGLEYKYSHTFSLQNHSHLSLTDRYFDLNTLLQTLNNQPGISAYKTRVPEYNASSGQLALNVTIDTTHPPYRETYLSWAKLLWDTKRPHSDMADMYKHLFEDILAPLVEPHLLHP